MGGCVELKRVYERELNVMKFSSCEETRITQFLIASGSVELEITHRKKLDVMELSSREGEGITQCSNIGWDVGL